MSARASVEICPDNFSWADYFELKFAVAGYTKHYVPREDFIPRLPSSGDQRNPVALQVKPMALLSSVSRALWAHRKAALLSASFPEMPLLRT